MDICVGLVCRICAFFVMRTSSALRHNAVLRLPKSVLWYLFHVFLLIGRYHMLPVIYRFHCRSLATFAAFAILLIYIEKGKMPAAHILIVQFTNCGAHWNNDHPRCLVSRHLLRSVSLRLNFRVFDLRFTLVFRFRVVWGFLVLDATSSSSGIARARCVRAFTPYSMYVCALSVITSD